MTTLPYVTHADAEDLDYPGKGKIPVIVTAIDDTDLAVATVVAPDRNFYFIPSGLLYLKETS